MNKELNHNGFFPNLLSVMVFTLIMTGLFFLFTLLYPSFVRTVFAPKKPENIQTIVADLAPFIRGIVLGIESSQRSAFPDTTLLNVNQVKGYEKGITAAVLTGKNWYDLDRQLFRIRGIGVGIQTAEYMSKQNPAQGTLQLQVALTQAIQNALLVNVDDLLSANTTHRESTLINFLAGLRNLSAQASIEVANLARVVSEQTSMLDDNQKIANDLSDALSTDAAGLNISNVDRNLNLSLEARKKAEAAKLMVLTSQQVLGKLAPTAASLNVLIDALAQNQEALIRGVKVKLVPGVNLPLLRE